MRMADPARCGVLGEGTPVVAVGKGKVDEERSGDLGDLRMVAYREPSSGPWVCCEEAEAEGKEKG